MLPDFQQVIADIRKILDREESVLSVLNENTITTRRNHQNRTIKQLLGHLVDSASNNHQRMVRLQYNERLIFPDYTQDNDLWIALQDYQHAAWQELIQLWKFYNLHIIRVIGAVDKNKLDNYWCDFEDNKVTLREMIEGYTGHLRLHIDQIHELIRMQG